MKTELCKYLKVEEDFILEEIFYVCTLPEGKP